MEQILEWDKDLFLYLNNLGSPKWDAFWNIITTKWYSIPVYVLLLYLLFKKVGWKSTVMALILTAILITCTDQLANIFKHGFERLRPCRQEGVMEKSRFVAERCGSFGFFSAHAANAMAIAIFIGSILSKYFKYSFPLLLIWVFLVSYSRIYLGVHYPGDIITGIIIGGILGLIAYRLYTKSVQKYIQKQTIKRL